MSFARWTRLGCCIHSRQRYIGGSDVTSTLRLAAAGLLAFGFAASEAAAQTTTVSIFGDIGDVGMNPNPFGIVVGDDFEVTATYTTTMATTMLSGTDPTLGDTMLMFMLDIFEGGTMNSRLTVAPFNAPLTQADDFNAPFGPLYVLDNGTLTDIGFETGPPFDPSLSLQATTLSTIPKVDLLLTGTNQVQQTYTITGQQRASP